jgi:hypothetical protein
MLLKVLAWISLIVGILGALGAFVMGLMPAFTSQAPGQMLALGMLGGLATAVMVLVMGIIYFVLLYAGGESIYVFLDIEENTRTMVQILRQRSP